MVYEVRKESKDKAQEILLRPHQMRELNIGRLIQLLFQNFFIK